MKNCTKTILLRVSECQSILEYKGAREEDESKHVDENPSVFLIKHIMSTHTDDFPLTNQSEPISQRNIK